MTVHAPLTTTMTKEAFLTWLERSGERYEYAGGRAVMMVRITRSHSILTSNLMFALRSRLKPVQYHVAPEGFAVDIGESVRFPDILVEPMQADGKALEAKAPILIVEVLSPGTLHVDFGDKKREYLGLPSLQIYLVISPDEPRAWLWQRAGEAFPPEPDIVEGLGNALPLPALGIDIPLREIYQGVC